MDQDTLQNTDQILRRSYTMSFENPGFFEEMRMEWLWNRLGSYRYRKYVETLPLEPDDTVLDFGCGAGALSQHIAKRLPQGRLICIDTSKFWLEKAKKRLQKDVNVDFICKRMEDTAIGNIDAISIHFVLHDIPKNERQDIINVLARKLRPGGHIFIREPTRADHGMGPEEVKHYMESAGLKMESEYTNSYFLWPHYTGSFSK